MKLKHVLVATSLLATAATFSQKNELKAAEKAFKNANASEALTLLQQAESLIDNATEPEKAQFYFLKASSLLNLAEKNQEKDKNQAEAVVNFNKVIAIEKQTKKLKHTELAEKSIKEIKDSMLAQVDADGKSGNYSGGSAKLKAIYDMDTTDLEKLYFAANYAMNAKEYDKALVYLDELIEKNYSGEATYYYAKNAVSGKEDYFGFDEAAKANRTQKIGVKLYSDARDEKVPSKRGEILKNKTLILVHFGKIEEAKVAVQKAREANPNDVSLIMTEADLYLQEKNYDKYKELISKVLEKNPNDKVLFFNLGVISAKAKNNAEAENYYLKAIELDPNYEDAYLNLAAVKLDAEEVIINEMNKLGNSEKEMKRYDVLKDKRESIFREVIPILEKGYAINPKNETISKTLLGMYKALEMTAKVNELKAKM